MLPSGVFAENHMEKGNHIKAMFYSLQDKDEFAKFYDFKGFEK